MFRFNWSPCRIFRPARVCPWQWQGGCGELLGSRLCDFRESHWDKQGDISGFDEDLG